MRWVSAEVSGVWDLGEDSRTTFTRSRGRESTSQRQDRSMILDNILFAYRAFQIDDALAFELPDQGDDLLLGRFNVAHLDRAQAIHVFLQHFGAALGHAFQEVSPQLVAGALESHRKDLAVAL